ncbi:MAG: beta-galactosidase [Clostridia bacterium]|nr:beta-galactosidase [Clostridia bacterium]
MGILSYDKDSFYMDGERYTVLSGAIHYFRVPREYWYDRLLKLKECGFNTVETYTPWNLHEPREGEFDFSGNLDIVKFIETAGELGLNVILRPGPYICAEWDFGGLPAWLLTYEKMPLRCADEVFLSKVERYYNELLPRVLPHLSTRGGNIIMIQVENEYGSYGDDKDYLRAIAEIYMKNGIDCLYFTSDGTNPSMLSGGTLDEYLAVANFGSRPEVRLPLLKAFRKDQPLMCGEYWCGWFDHWFEEHHTRTAEEIVTDCEGFFKLGASFNFYMFHGGTNFGFMNGANYSDKYEPTTTSYDYCAPLSEAGDRTPTYYALRELIKKYRGEVPPLSASETKKKAYGKVMLTEIAELFENIDRISTPVHSPTPKFMEELGQGYGYILYRTAVRGAREPKQITVDDLHHRVGIFLDGVRKGTYYVGDMPKGGEGVILKLDTGATLQMDLLVENMGRVNYGPHLRDRGGIGAVRMGNQYHFGWDIYCLPMGNELSRLEFKAKDTAVLDTPAFLRGYFDIDEPCDTFLRLGGLHKGFVKINGINIGRYFNDAGPEKTLFVPAPFLKTGKNEILVFESDGAESCEVEFLSTPEFS